MMNAENFVENAANEVRLYRENYSNFRQEAVKLADKWNIRVIFSC